ncbi:MAG: ATP-binding protein [Flavobacteriales bacterium]|nr:ATP-binding protein [Flavobacteriales bacterium]MBP6698510.1 ATP-binding protein [Flavobacteriales bacterium]
MRRHFPVLVLVCVLATPLLSTELFASRQEKGHQARLTGVADARQRAEVLLELSNTLEVSRPSECLAHRRSALGFAEQGQDERQLHRVLEALRESELAMSSYDALLGTTLRALEVSQALKDEMGIADDLQWLSKVYRLIGQPQQAMEACQQALALAQIAGDPGRVADAHLRLMHCLGANEQYAKAYEHGELAGSIYTGLGDRKGLAQRWLIGGELMLAQGRSADALPYLVKAQRDLSLPDGDPVVIQLRQDLVEAHIGLGDLRLAAAHMDSLRALIAGRKDRENRLAYHELAFQLADAQRDPVRALSELRQLVALKDSLLNVQTARQLAGMQTLYQLNNKERDNRSLRERNAMNEAVIAGSSRRNRTMAYLVVVLSVLVVALSIMGRLNLRSMGRIRLKNKIIHKQSQEIHEKNLALQRQNTRLTETLISEEEKDLMLREIHHRVKNDLQIVNTLLRLQTAHLEAPGLQQALEDCQRRVGAMAMVHDQLYRSADLKDVSTLEHVRKLAESVLRSFSAEHRIEASVDSDVGPLPVEMLIPLGLLLNELLTNSVKHAYPGQVSGKVHIAMTLVRPGVCRLRYADNGTGFQGEHSFRSGTFGHDLVQALAGQLNGQLRIYRSDGTTYELEFPLGEQALRRAS